MRKQMGVFKERNHKSILFSFLTFLRHGSPVELETSEFDSVEADDQICRQNDLKEETRQHRGWAKQQAKQVLLEAEFDCLERFSSVFDHSQLDDDCHDHNDQEKFVVEEVFENVVLISFEFSGVDLVEDLKQHEDIEEDGVVFTSLVVPVFDSDWARDSEDFRT